MGYLYRWIGFIILGGGCILACFLPWIFPDTGFSFSLIYFAYFSFLASSLIGYFINYRQNLLGADQKNYVVTGYFQGGNILKVIIQIVLAYYTHNWFLWIAVEFVFGILYSIILNWKINKTYPWLKADIKLGRKMFKKYPEVMTKTKQLFIHRMIPFTQYQCTSFLIYAFTTLTNVALYGNYTIILDKATQLINNAYSPLTAGVGNLIAEGNETKTERIYWELLSVRFIVAGAIGFGVIFLAQPFITLWIGKQYLLGNTIVYLLSASMFVRLTREVTDPFLFGAGLFQDVWAPVVEIIVYFAVAVPCGFFYGLGGVLLGGIASMFVIGWLWKPYFLYTRLFKSPLSRNILILTKNLSVIIAAFAVSTYICSYFTFINPYKSFLNLIIYSILIMMIYLIINVITMYLFSTGFRYFILRLKGK